MTDAEPVQVFPIPIGSYVHLQHLSVDGEVTRLCAVLAEFGGRLADWPVPADERGRDAVDARLLEWTASTEHTVLYWVGHGESTGDKAALAHRLSPPSYAENGVTPDVLAGAILGRQDDSWAVVIVDACQSARFVELLGAELFRDLAGVRRVLLVGTSGDGRAWLGRFTSTLETCLRHTFRTNAKIELADLADQLERMLPECRTVGFKLADSALVRDVPVAAGLSAPLDVLAGVEAVLAGLTEDERRHFVPKAQSAENGEVTWYFEGRARERGVIVDWLRDHDTGLLAVTGPPGSGKSALLGHVLVHTRPQLRTLLARHGLVDPLPAAERPPDNAFDAAIHLTGMTVTDFVLAISDVLGMKIGVDLTWMVDGLVDELREQPLTLLVDALDEAQDPLAIAAVLSRLATIVQVRLVVGTRRSTKAGPDLPEPTDEDLLHALGTDEVLTIRRDPDAIGRFIRRRLTMGDPTATESEIDHAVEIITGTGQEFLFARLAVHEIITRTDLPPTWVLNGVMDLTTNTPLSGLFISAYLRLARVRRTHADLLSALAASRGRGLPIRDGVWGTVAGVSTGRPPPNDDDIVALLADAAPYVMLDSEGGQSVYRLAHRAFQETIRDLAANPREIAAALLRAAAAHDRPLNPYLARHLSGHLGETGEDGWESLAAHPSVLERLDPRAVAADVLRTAFGRMTLPPEIAGVFGAQHLLQDAAPEDLRGIREVATARYANIRDFPGDGPEWSVRHALLRQHPVHLTLAGHDGTVNAVVSFVTDDGRPRLATGGEDETIRLWDPLTGTQLGAPLSAGTAVTSLVMLADGVLASAGRDDEVTIWHGDKRVRVWTTDHIGPITALAAYRRRNEPDLVATGGFDGVIRLWDPRTGAAVGFPLTGTGPAVMALTSFGKLLAGAHRNGRVSVWNTDNGRLVHEVDGGRQSRLTGLAAITSTFGDLLAASDQDGRIRIHNLNGGQDPVERGGAKPLRSVTAFPTGTNWTVAAGDEDGTVWLWDSTERVLTGHTGAVTAMTTVLDRTRRYLLVTASSDGTVRVWDTEFVPDDVGTTVGLLKKPTGIVAMPDEDNRTALIIIGASECMLVPDDGPLIRYRASMHAVTTFHRDGRPYLVAVDDDGCARLGEFAVPVERIAQVGRPHQLAVVQTRDGRVRLAAAGIGQRVRAWDLDTGKPADFPDAAYHDGGTTVVATVTAGGQPLVASGGLDGTVQVWEPDTGVTVSAVAIRPGLVTELLAVGARLAARAGGPAVHLWDPLDATSMTLLKHSTKVTALTTMTWNGRTVLVSGDGGGTVRIWDPARGDLIRELPVGIPVSAMVAVDDGLAIASPEGVLRLGIHGGEDRADKYADRNRRRQRRTP